MNVYQFINKKYEKTITLFFIGAIAAPTVIYIFINKEDFNEEPHIVESPIMMHMGAGSDYMVINQGTPFSMNL